jgi:hypothetical protein
LIWAFEQAGKNACVKELYDTHDGDGLTQAEWKVKSFTKSLVYCKI